MGRTDAKRSGDDTGAPGRGLLIGSSGGDEGGGLDKDREMFAPLGKVDEELRVDEELMTDGMMVKRKGGINSWGGNLWGREIVVRSEEPHVVDTGVVCFLRGLT
jgi:hypothetical protein